ncbi:MAG: L-2-hydroxyglutarate oxidase [Planctomycetota bacterium]|nr:L-2-hydroxyglutarate oxidase [Planctomycetota bacterium]
MYANRFDFAIIGGGIIGLAVARALSAERPRSLIVLEAEGRLAAHQTGHNSGVIHSGLYYRPGSSKARNCALGREAMYRFCAEHGIPHQQCGKVVVATREQELPALEQLHERGIANGLLGLRRLSGEELREFEPHAAGLAGLHVPQTGIVDFVAVANKFAELAADNGVQIRTDHRLTGVSGDGHELVLSTTEGEVRCKFLINCAGLHCDRVARLCGMRPGLRIIPFRGEYYELNTDRTSLVRDLIYPVPDPRFPFLGVHFTRMIHGGVEAGPNAVLALARHGYGKLSFAWRDAWETLTYPGFVRLGFRYGRMGMGELYRSLFKRAFVAELKRLVPEITADDVHRAGAGVRAQAVAPDGRLVDDFHIEQGDRAIHVLNAPSPAATASISIGETIADMARREFDG